MVSIVMATYNGAAYLEEQIESIVKNTYTDWHLEICDDGSTDRTLEIATAWQERYPDKISITVNQENVGVTNNFLEGAKRAKGDYIMFCDQDDVWFPNKIADTLHFMQEKEQEAESKKPVLVFTDAKLVNAVLQKMGDSFFAYNKLDTTKIDLQHLLIENKVIGCTAMFNRALTEKLVVAPQQARYHDWWVALIAATFGQVYYFDQVTMYYRQHGANVVGAQNFVSYVWNKIQHFPDQKENLIACEKQAWEFLEIYNGDILEEQRQIIADFANLQSVNWIERKDRLFRYGYWKSGKIRNIGLFLLI